MRFKSLFQVANHMVKQSFFRDALLIYLFLAYYKTDVNVYSKSYTYLRDYLYPFRRDFSILNDFQELFSNSDLINRLCISNILANLEFHELIELPFLETNGRKDPQISLCKANALRRHNPLSWLDHVNNYLDFFGLAPASLSPLDGSLTFNNLRNSTSNVTNGPLVSICVSCFNAANFVNTAILSLLNQSYRNVEVIAVDDCSTDNTLEILDLLASTDTRVKVVRNERNSGTYVSRNRAFDLAQGEFFTVLDADDFAIGSRIEEQVKQLLRNPSLIGVMTDWVRLAEDGQFVFKIGRGRGFNHESVATLMFRVQPVKLRMGYWDSVRFAADTEHLYRMKRVFGEQAILHLRIPAVFSLSHEASLTNHPELGIDVNGRSGLSPVRQQYREMWKAWHHHSGTDFFIPFPQQTRSFPVPEEMR